jgi:hypothetical protein
MRHPLDLLLRILDRLGDRSGKLFEQVGEVKLLGAGLASRRLVLRVGLDTSVRVETADNTVCFGENLAALLDQWADLADELLLVELLLGLSLGRLDPLFRCQRGLGNVYEIRLPS